MWDKRRSFILLLLVFTLSGCGANAATEIAAVTAKPRAALQTPDYSDVAFQAWDVKAASAGLPKRASKPYTIMVYMNGSDLESESGAGTLDLIQMLESGVRAKNLNLVVFTGGTLRWQNDVIPSNSCMVWEIANGQIEELADVGLHNMGNAGTLASFIEFGMTNFPAEKYGLIMWDHGGGSIAGYGHDEKFSNSTLTLLDMGYAFDKAGLSGKKLEFLGFDSCLMATVEMAIVASGYAKTLIASEDLSPGDGWDYGCLAVLNDTPGMDGAALGMAITDSFMNYYGPYADDILNISVIDLSQVDRVMSAMGALMGRCSQSLLEDRVGAGGQSKGLSTTFRALARRRNGTRSFGNGSPRDNESDMVDIGDMAYKLSDLFPDEAAEVFAALDESVLYNRNNSGIYLSGLSTYYVYSGREAGRDSLNVYTALRMDEEYTGYLHRFFNNLTSGTTRSVNDTTQTRSGTRSATASANGPLPEDSPQPEDILRTDLTVWQPAPDGDGWLMVGLRCDVLDAEEALATAGEWLWPQIDSRSVPLFRINTSGGNALYAAPAVLDGRDCDIIVLISEKYPFGKILGARNEVGYIIQKGYDPITDGAELAFYYPTRDRADAENGWMLSEAFTVDGELKLDWAQNTASARYSLRLTDIRNNEHMTELY